MSSRQIPLDQIGVMGDRCDTSDAWRIELAVLTGSGKDRPDLLHDEKSVADFSLVHRGQLRLGGFVLPLAVKVQREQALNGEQLKSVRAKFDAERLAFLRVQGIAGAEPPVVRLHDLGPDPGSVHAADLPACLVCRHARHALRPLCPACRSPLQPLEPGDGQRFLCCSNSACRKEYAAADRERVVRSSVRQAGACDGCTQDEASCAASVFVLCYFPSRVLLFDLLDLDLEEFLAGKEHPAARAGRPPFWQAYERLGDTRRPDRELAEVLDLFRQIVTGTQALHDLDISHYDLKPRNICLAAREGRLLVRLIDLGFADAPREQVFLMQSQGTRGLHTSYAAPELHKPVSDLFKASLVLEAGQPWCILRSVLDMGDLLDSPAVAGDLLDVRLPGQDNIAWSASIVEVRFEKPSSLRLRLDPGGLPPRLSLECEVQVLRQAGPAADIFSLGMVLLILLTREFHQAATIRGKIGEWFKALAAPTPRRTPGRLVSDLRSLPDTTAESFKVLERTLDRFGPGSRSLAESLLALSLRMLVRSADPALQALTLNRADRGPALETVREELEWVAARLEASRLRADLEADRDLLQQAGRKLRSKLTPPVPGRQPAGSEIPYEPGRMEAALRAVGAERKPLLDRELQRLLAEYRTRPDLLHVHLARFLSEDAAAKSPSSPGEQAVVPVLDRQQVETLSAVLRFGVPLSDQNDGLDRLAQAEEAGRQNPDEPPEWLGEASPLAARVRAFRESFTFLERAARAVASLFLEANDRERGRETPLPLTFHLGSNLRELVCDAQALAGLARLGRATDWGQEIYKELDRRWSEALEKWKSLPSPYRSSLNPCLEAAIRERRMLGVAHQQWAEALGRALTRIGEQLTQVASGVLAAWDRARRPGLLGAPRLATVRIDPATAALPSARDLLASVEEILALRLGPSARIAGRLLLERIDRERTAAK